MPSVSNELIRAIVDTQALIADKIIAEQDKINIDELLKEIGKFIDNDMIKFVNLPPQLQIEIITLAFQNIQRRHNEQQNE